MNLNSTIDPEDDDDEMEFPAPSSSLTMMMNLQSIPIGSMREVIFRIAAMQPMDIDPDSLKPPKRRNVRISNDPRTVAARHRRERISQKIRILHTLVPGRGTKMDTASMLDEAIHYVNFLKCEVQSLERVAAAGGNVNRAAPSGGGAGVGLPVSMSRGTHQFPSQNRSGL